MRTAKEMSEFACQFLPGEESVKKLERCPFHRIEAELMSDEQVIFCFGANQGKAAGLTNYRMIHAQTKDAEFDWPDGVRSIHYNTITNVFTANTFLNVSINGKVELTYGDFTMEKIRSMAFAISDAIQTFKRQDLTKPPQEAAAQQLKQLKALLESGELSLEAYERKKKILLGLQ